MFAYFLLILRFISPFLCFYQNYKSYSLLFSIVCCAIWNFKELVLQIKKIKGNICDKRPTLFEYFTSLSSFLHILFKFLITFHWNFYFFENICDTYFLKIRTKITIFPSILRYFSHFHWILTHFKILSKSVLSPSYS